jgi:hypothetical protein
MLLAVAGAVVLAAVVSREAGTASLPTLQCGAAARCELAADADAMRVLAIYHSLEARRGLTWPERGQVSDAYGNLVLAGRIVRVKAGVRIHVVQLDPPNVSGGPRFARVRMMEGDLAGRELIAPAESLGGDR